MLPALFGSAMLAEEEWGMEWMESLQSQTMIIIVLVAETAI